MSSQQVSFWSVVEFVADRLGVSPEQLPEASRRLPMLGTPEWCALDNSHPDKIRACLVASPHWALRAETAQESRCEASRAVSRAAEWNTVGRERGNAYIGRVSA